MYFLTFILTCLTLAHTPAFAGGSVSGGADFQPEMAAWFTSADLSASVKFCVQATPDFLTSSGKTLSDLQALTQTSFQTWANYYESIGGNLRSPDPTLQTSCAIDGVIRTNFRIATHAQPLDTCDGTEDLTVFFGVDNPAIEQARQKYNFPFAFSSLNDIVDLNHAQTAWSKGFIWIAPPKSINPSASIPLWGNFGGAPLEMVLLHEMGHVFGSEHIAGTIMDGDIGNTLIGFTDIAHASSTRAEFNPVFLTIDRNSYLVFVPENQINQNMVIRTINCNSADEGCLNQNQGYASAVYRDLTLFDLIGTAFSAILTKAQTPLPLEIPADLDLTSLMSLNLLLSGDGIQSQFQFIPSVVLENTAVGKVFNEACRTYTHNQVSLFGTLSSVSGSIPAKEVVLNINSDYNPIEILDPHLDANSDYCKLYVEEGKSCAILSSEL